MTVYSANYAQISKSLTAIVPIFQSKLRKAYLPFAFYQRDSLLFLKCHLSLSIEGTTSTTAHINNDQSFSFLEYCFVIVPCSASNTR